MKNKNLISGIVSISSNDLLTMFQFEDLFLHQSLVEIQRFGCPIKKQIVGYKQEFPIEAIVDGTLLEGVEKWLNNVLQLYTRFDFEKMAKRSWSIVFRYTAEDVKTGIKRTEKIVLNHKKGLPLYALRPQLVKSTLRIDHTIDNVANEFQKIKSNYAEHIL